MWGGKKTEATYILEVDLIKHILPPDKAVSSLLLATTCQPLSGIGFSPFNITYHFSLNQNTTSTVSKPLFFHEITSMLFHRVMTVDLFHRMVLMVPSGSSLFWSGPLISEIQQILCILSFVCHLMDSALKTQFCHRLCLHRTHHI